jgi:uncharacterized membrane protein YfcA
MKDTRLGRVASAVWVLCFQPWRWPAPIDPSDWPLAGLFIAGGLAGGLAGARSAKLLADRKGMLTTVFAFLIFAVALYVLVRSLPLI